MNPIIKGLKTFLQLGARQSVLYAWYQFELRSGYLRWKTGAPRTNPRQPSAPASDLFALPNRERLLSLLGAEGLKALQAEADDIVQGKVRLFGGSAVSLQLELDGPLKHWTIYDGSTDTHQTRDIKFIWEPARFGWACTLARAYFLSRDERYAISFWSHTESFLEANPPYLGPNWASAQEVALRLVAITYAWQIFCRSPHTTAERVKRLSAQVAFHAERIPPTLAYARAQNNNHLISEALGLYTAGLALPAHPQAAGWRTLGWRGLNRALQSQINPDGTYVQHSANYHRLVLQAALWANILAANRAQHWPKPTSDKLAVATLWLLRLLDPASGCTPNLGPNDGAYILPLTVQPFPDYRPVLQAASQSFLGKAALETGAWDEMAIWFGLSALKEEKIVNAEKAELTRSNLEIASGRKNTGPRNDIAREIQPGPAVLRPAEADSWAYLRATRFHSRPGHADQLHLDLWWRGLNLAQDAGTYLYNAPPPWDNSFTRTSVHNTLTANGQEQMSRLSRFLYVGWAQAEILAWDPTRNRIVAQHDGYRRLGLVHRRSVEYRQGYWMVSDRLLPIQARRRPGGAPVTARLHWLLPDWPWEIKPEKDQIVLSVESPEGPVHLTISGRDSLRAGLVRAGEWIYGEGPMEPSWGWTSPTYGYKIPALSFSVWLSSLPPLEITSEWALQG